MTAPTVSVFIVNWNSGEYLRAALVALSAQSFTDFEVIVVDNASTDCSQKCVAEFGDARFKLVELDTNTGFAAANNTAALQANAKKFFALLNPDAFPDSEWLQRLVSAAGTENAYGAFSSSLVDARDTTLWDGTGDCYRITGQPYRRDHLQSRLLFQRSKAEVFSPCAAAALYKRQAWDAARGFDEDLFCYSEDVDLGFRLQLLGYKILHVPDAICFHIGSGVVGKRSDFATYFGQRNLSLVFLKNMPGPLLILLLPLHIVSVFAAFFLFLKRGQGRIFLLSKIASIKLIPNFWQKRRKVQHTRSLSTFKVWAILDKSLW